MARNKSDAQPHKKLTDEEWELLWGEYQTEKEVSVEELCSRRGVSRARFYEKFGTRISELKKAAAKKNVKGRASTTSSGLRSQSGVDAPDTHLVKGTQKALTPAKQSASARAS